MSTPQQLTQQQIQNYQNIIDNQGINGVSSVYQDLASKGYNYAGWADGVATGNTTTGQAALGYMQNSAGHDLTSNQISNIRVDMLNGYLNALNEQTANGGNVSRDVDYGETRQFHEQVFNRNGLSIDNWTLNDPMEMIRKYGGGTAEWLASQLGHGSTQMIHKHYGKFIRTDAPDHIAKLNSHLAL